MRRVVAAFALVLTCAVLVFLGVGALVEREAAHGREVNVAGRQRMLAQRVGFLAHLIGEPGEEQRHRAAQLDATLDLLEDSHSALRDGGTAPALDRSRRGAHVDRAPGEVREILFGRQYRLDATMRDFVESGRDLAARDEPASADDPQLDSFIEQMEGPLIAALDAATRAYEVELSRATSESRTLTALAVGTVVLALTTALGVRASRRRAVASRAEAEAERRRSEARFRAAAEGSFDAFSILEAVREPGGRVIDFEYADVNARLTERLGRSRDEIVGRTVREVTARGVEAGAVDRYARVLESGEAADEEILFAPPDAAPAGLRVMVVPLGDGVAVTSRDITERKEREERLAYQAHHDVLTGLPNRATLLDRLEYVLSGGSGHDVAVLFVDLDGFKDVNDAFGHETGDELLRLVADRLRATVRSGDTVARLGGDEFVVLCERVRAAEEAEEAANRIVDAMAKPFLLGVGPVSIAASVGLAGARTGCTPRTLLRRADVAVYEAKRLGGSRVAVAPLGAPVGEPS